MAEQAQTSATAESGIPQYSPLTKENKLQFAAMYLLEYMARTGTTFPLVLENDAVCLREILDHLLMEDCCVIVEGNRYSVNDKGMERVQAFRERYTEYLKLYDIYSAVDLETGEFAFARYYELESEPWRAYIALERWEDLRIAVAEYKKLNPVEIVFMSFLLEGKFGLSANGWEFELLMGNVWDQIIKICNSNLHWQQLGYGDVSAESVIEDVINKGAALLVDLLQKEAEQQSQEPDNNDGNEVIEETIVTETVETVEYDDVYAYYDPYLYDPFYYSPVWAVPLFAPPVVVWI